LSPAGTGTVQLEAIGLAVVCGFGRRGVRLYGASAGEEHAFTPGAAVQQADGKVVVAGTAREDRRTKAELLRFLIR
jgi:hypothetical protein